ncbi:MAG: hypothetical protein HY660_05265 [Armatimonadetes bacterium]|nr:hypothetical protein [Armatimonadota bacterium]
MRKYIWPVLAVLVIATLLVVVAVQHQALQAAHGQAERRTAALGQGLQAWQQALARCQEEVGQRVPAQGTGGTGGPVPEFIPLGGRP